MRPEKVSSWRERLPPPFDKPSPPLKRRASAAQFKESLAPYHGSEDSISTRCRKRRDSAPGAADQVDRRVTWLRIFQAQHARFRREKSSSAVEKLRRYFEESLCVTLADFADHKDSNGQGSEDPQPSRLSTPQRAWRSFQTLRLCASVLPRQRTSSRNLHEMSCPRWRANASRQSKSLGSSSPNIQITLFAYQNPLLKKSWRLNISCNQAIWVPASGGNMSNITRWALLGAQTTDSHNGGRTLPSSRSHQSCFYNNVLLSWTASQDAHLWREKTSPVSCPCV